MNKFKSIGSVITAVKSNVPSIFTGAAIVCMVDTVMLTVNATITANEHIYRKAEEKEELTKLEKFQATYKDFIPVAMMGGVTIALICAANYIHLRKEAGLAAAYTIFESRHNAYRDKNRKIFSPQNDTILENAIDEEQINRNPPPEKLKKYAQEEGLFLCYEPYTEQYFCATKTQLMWAELTANKILQQEEKVTLNQILALFPDISHTKPEGNTIGWYLNDDYYEFIGYNWGFFGRPWIDLAPIIEPSDGQEVVVIRFTLGPTHEDMAAHNEIPNEFPEVWKNEKIVDSKI